MVRIHSAEYWHGWQAVATRQSCTFTDKCDRREWARGFAAAVAMDQESKVWWKSKTMLIGIILLLVGGGLILFGFQGGGNSGGMYAAAGGGMSASSLLFTALRLITDKPITIGSGQYTNQTPSGM
jgi:hypothetical protein